MVTRQRHWEDVYETKLSTEVSWYAPQLRESLRLIEEVAPLHARIIDVGAGASTLVDDLLAHGYRDITLLDISDKALALTRQRLGERAGSVRCVTADITRSELAPAAFDIWHDRAVFHFLTEASAREAYVQRLRASLAPGGHVVLATFALSGPSKCSGLEVVRYDAEGVQRELGPLFDLETTFETSHTTPVGKEQRFLFCRLRRR